MNREQELYLSLLKDYVHEKRSYITEKDILWKRLLRYARQQNTMGILYNQLKDTSLPESVRKDLKQGFLSDVYLSVNSSCALEKIGKEFSKEAIEYLPFKGSLMKEYYPHPELRTMGDRDILIRNKDRAKTDQIMNSLGFDRFIDNHAVYTYTKKHLMFEIHDVMFYEELSNSFDYRSYFKKIWDSAVKEEGYSYLPDKELHFVYTLVHTAKHTINKGMGFRAFLDMVFFSENANADWNKIIALLKEIKLYEFTANCFSLCEKWFNITMPFRNEDPDMEFLGSVTEKIFRDGIFGFDNEDNLTGYSAKMIRRSEKSYTKAATEMTLHRIFPPYRDMQLIPWYSWVDGKPWLLPAAWIYRWGYCLFNKRKEGTDLLLLPYQKKKEIEEREEYLKKWGL